MVENIQQTKWTTFDVIKSLLANINTNTITSSLPLLHETLYKLQNQQEFKPLLKDYIFENRSYFHFCDDFQTDIVNLEQSGHLSCLNPDFKEYNIKEELKNSFEKNNKNLFESEELIKINKMSKKFIELINS